ncbi:LysR family transcriptional regulator [Thiotrichales bacterium 19S3-7]|nr:LysR family transcriptional regulator [Thiotrichales bacterium 19S3-7]MCF6801072.1 LysR family transcriptional regulator [Thiotrichales bacterium 19S3-11]
MFKLPPLKSLIIFDAVARALHFARAAEELNITPSAVSQQIKILENYLGCFLIKRNNKSVSLTPQGKRFYESIHEALKMISSATEALKPTKSNVVHLEVATTLAMQWLIPNLPKLQLEHPEIELIISTNVNALSEQSQMLPDISIIPEKHTIDNPHQLLWLDKLILIASPKINQKNIASAIKNYTAISVAHPMRTSDWQTFCQHNKIQPPKNTLVLSNTIQAIEAVKNNAGILVTHLPLVYQEIENKSIKVIGNAVATGNAFYLHYSPQRIPSTNARKVKDWLLQLVDNFDQSKII